MSNLKNIYIRIDIVIFSSLYINICNLMHFRIPCLLDVIVSLLPTNIQI